MKKRVTLKVIVTAELAREQLREVIFRALRTEAGLSDPYVHVVQEDTIAKA